MMQSSHDATERGGHALKGALALVVAVCFALGGTVVTAQSPTATKQAESLAKAGEQAKKAVQRVVGQLGKLLKEYNAIMDGSAKNPQSAYKKLLSEYKSTNKTIEKARQSLNAMNKEAQKFFAAWETELEVFASESLKRTSLDRLNASREKYAALGEALDKARNAFAPVLQDLNDQILILARDLSPGAIAALQEEAAALNQQVVEISEEVRGLVQSDTR